MVKQKAGRSRRKANHAARKARRRSLEARLARDYEQTMLDLLFHRLENAPTQPCASGRAFYENSPLVKRAVEEFGECPPFGPSSS